MIERDFLDGDGSLPILFHVTESFEVWDGQVALVLDHLLNHIKVLTDVAEGPADQAVVDKLVRYPRYQIDRFGYEANTSQEEVSNLLIEECLILMRCLTKIAPIMEIEQPARTALLEKTRSQIPFLDYRYVDDRHRSDAAREDYD